MDRFLKYLFYSIPILAFAALLVYVFNPHLADTGTRRVLNDTLRAAGEFPCPEYDAIRENILDGGPPKDGIPAISDAEYESADMTQLADSDYVFGITYGNFVAAYPESIMVWHEIVNETVGDDLISITYCPLTRSAMGFTGYNLGVTGQLYNSNLVMYDRRTQSRFPQILGTAIDGELCGTRPTPFPVRRTTWKKWHARYPETLVMTSETGYRRDYETDPYEDYYTSPETLFPITHESQELEPKTLVLGIRHGGESAAVVMDGFVERHPEGLSFIIDGEPVTVWYDMHLDTMRADSSISQMEVFWFAWYAQFPDTTLYK